MQILHVAGKIDPKLGGVGQAIRTMVKGLAGLGMRNELCTLDNPQAAFLTAEKLTIHTPGEGRGAWYYSPNLMPWLLQNLGRFDIVVVHGLWQQHGFAVHKAIRLLKRKAAAGTIPGSRVPKFFMMPHGMLDPYFQGAAGRKIKALRNWAYWKLIENKIIHQADGLLFTCLQEQQLAGTTFSPYRPRIEPVIGLGVQEPPAFHETMKKAFLEKCPGLNDAPYLLFLSRIHEKKGLDLLVDAYKNLLQEVNAGQAGNPPVKTFPKLVIAGPGLDTPYGEKIRQQVAAAGLAGNPVLFTGMLTGDAKWGAFYGCDAFVLPSHQENFGIALVEAMACRKPVLISNQVNIWREVMGAGAGFIADDTLQGTLDLLHSWKQLTAQEKPAMGYKARSCFEKKFAIDGAAREMLLAIST